MVGATGVTGLLIVHNEERFIREALESLVAQTHRLEEIVVVDDGSTDGTPSIVSDAGLRDPRIRLVKVRRAGRVEALNHGIGTVRSPFIAMMDGDDRCRPERIDRQMSVLMSEPSAAFVSCGITRIGEDGKGIRGRAGSTRSSVGPAANSTMLVRTDVLRAHRYRAGFPHAEDYDLFSRIRDAGHLMLHLDEPLYEYRMNASGTSFAHREAQIASTVNAKISSQLRRRGIEDVFDADPRPDPVVVRWDRCPEDAVEGLRAKWRRSVLSGLDLRQRAARERAVELSVEVLSADSSGSGAGRDVFRVLVATALHLEVRSVMRLARAAAAARRSVTGVDLRPD